MPRAAPILFILALIVGGTTLICYGSWRLHLGKQSLSWPSVEGVITASKIVQKSRRARAHRTRWYEIDIEYTYSVSGLTYTNNRWGYRGATRYPFWTEADYFSRRYPVGDRIEIFYAPTNPKRSVLRTGHDPWDRSFVVIGVIPILLALCGVLLLINRRSRLKRLRSHADKRFIHHSIWREHVQRIRKL